MIVATARPEFRAPWTTRSHHGIISLVPLDRQQVCQMVGSVAERNALSTDAVDGVAVRTGGVPWFIGEVTRLVLEGDAQTIPLTLQQSLAARLDRLSRPAKLRRLAPRRGTGTQVRLAGRDRMGVGASTQRRAREARRRPTWY